MSARAPHRDCARTGRLRVLHLFANHKFTGPADPALVLARALSDEGVDIQFAAGDDGRGGSGVRELARSRGISTHDALHLTKHGRPWPTLRDVLRLRRELRERRRDILHAHQPNDHLVAALAARGTGVPVVRSLYDDAPPRGLRAGAALRGTALVLSASARVVETWAAGPAAVERLDPVLDLERFSARRDDALRASWGVPPGEFVVGVVARMQPHRLFPELVAGFARAARAEPRLQLVILGRGTHRERVAHEPARRSGVRDRIHFPGYVDPERYPDCLPCFDVQLFLVPGSDGTCRAAREALSSGVPVICSRRGLLPELVEDGVTGVVLPAETPEAIGDALLGLARDPERVRRLGGAARESARLRFDCRRAARRVAALYRGLATGTEREP